MQKNARVIPGALRLCKDFYQVPRSVPRAGGLKEGQTEQVLSGLATFYVMHITTLFQGKSLKDCSTGAMRHFVTVVLSQSTWVTFFSTQYFNAFCPVSLSSRPSLPVRLSSGELSEYGCPYNSYGFSALRATSPLLRVCNDAPGSLILYLNEKGFTQPSTDWELSPSITESNGNKVEAC